MVAYREAYVDALSKTIIPVTSLTGVPPEYEAVVRKRMAHHDDDKCLLVTMYFMSDLPIDAHRLKVIKQRFERLFPVARKGWNVSTILRFRPEWFNTLQWGCWITTKDGNEMAQRLLRQENIFVTKAAGRKDLASTKTDETDVFRNEIRFEGAMKRTRATCYERSRPNRRKAIASQGTRCKICDFDFGETFGPVAEGFIHVHHVRELARVKEVHKPDPTKDLIPVCPNCHAVIHMRDPCYTIEEVREMRKSHAAF